MKQLLLIDPSILPNKTFNYKKAYQYAKLMESGVDFPTVNIYPNRNSKNLDFNDGIHRVAAAKMAGVKLKVKRSI